RRDVHTHYHVRRNNEADLAHLARRVTGNAFALTLGGGGARGLAHIGVIRALEEAGFRIDVIGGASVGALVGAGYAVGMDYREMMKLARDFATRDKWFDVTLPLVSFLASRKMTQLLDSLFGEINIEDLPRSYFSVSCNLTRADLVIHRSGPVWYAVRASTAMPGVFAPVPNEDGDLLVDGGVLNNVPADIAGELCEGGPVAAVNVSPDVDMAGKYAYGPSLSGWRLLLNRFLPPSRRVQAPPLLEILRRTTDLVTIHHGKVSRERVDLYINPDVAHYETFDFEPYEELIEAGYRAAWEQIEAWGQRA
ncbi:MAG: patatin-like phospholipase family protein, partial [Chloroflexota bacterium]|nr:patatin-like phospholipase family protein [Chloroflexota bacterium]